MRLWVLTMGAYSDRRIYGIYSSLQKAKDAATECVRRGWGSYCADIYETSLDGELEDDGIVAVISGEVVRGEDYGWGLDERDEEGRVDWEK